MWSFKIEISSKYVIFIPCFSLIFLWYIYQNVSNNLELWNNKRRYETLHTEIWAVVLLLKYVIFIPCFSIEAWVCLTVALEKSWYKLFVTWSHAISHQSVDNCTALLRVIKLQPRFLCAMSRICVYYLWISVYG
jgi:hypothetical protein